MHSALQGVTSWLVAGLYSLLLLLLLLLLYTLLQVAGSRFRHSEGHNLRLHKG